MKKIKTYSYLAFISISHFPEQVEREWLVPLLNLKGLSTNIFISTWRDSDINKKLNLIINEYEIKSEIQGSDSIKNARNLFNFEAFSHIAQKIASGNKLRKIQSILKIEASDQTELKIAIRRISKQLRRSGFQFTRLFFDQLNAMKSFIPTNQQFIKNIEVDALDDTIAFGYPFTSQELIHQKSLLFGLDENKTPVFIDWKLVNSEKPSSSSIIIGKTGGGKSTTCKRILKNQILQNQYKIYVIDPENEYGALFESMGGKSVTVNDPNFVINPFDLGLNYSEHSITDKDKINQLIDTAINNKKFFFESFFKIVFKEKLGDDKIAILVQSVYELYQTWREKEFIFSDLTDYIVNHHQYKNEDHLIQQLKMFSSNGVFASLWDKKTTFKMDNYYIAFQFRDLLAKSNSSISKAQIFLILQHLNNIILNNRDNRSQIQNLKEKGINDIFDFSDMKKKNLTKLKEIVKTSGYSSVEEAYDDMDSKRFINIVIDEAHLLLDERYLEIVQFTNEMYKRIRKYNGMMTLITQNISDFYEKESIRAYTQPLVNQAQYIICHHIDGNEIKSIDALLSEQNGLSTKEKEFLMNATPGQALLLSGNIRTKINVQK